MAQLFFTLADIVFAGGCLYVLLNAPDLRGVKKLELRENAAIMNSS